ncbi:MAG: SDR family NAD(P)-dependent oxidoreductase [Prevotellaceae bacterium]|jgi:NADP-dependent 3-hydroxy acid dehydrogenase YdfG|nr:SDR family NAD(P)-dependent oxidoreductase [Prevotellaceae bacterium]
MKKIALVTGATSGIGKATAIMLADCGFNLIITGRRNERLNELKSQLEIKYKSEALPLCFDIRNRNEVCNAIENIPAKWKNISVLVNNAGLAVGLNHIQDGLFDDWERMIDTNIRGLLYITRCVAPMMIENKQGHIINIGSVAGKDVYENGNVYCATKYAVDALSKAMRIDMLKHNIKVTNVCPGAVETEFSIVRFKDDTERAKATYDRMTPLNGDDIANVIRFVISLPPHVCVNDIVVTPTSQANALIIHRNENQ